MYDAIWKIRYHPTVRCVRYGGVLCVLHKRTVVFARVRSVAVHDVPGARERVVISNGGVHKRVAAVCYVHRPRFFIYLSS